MGRTNSLDVKNEKWVRLVVSYEICERFAEATLLDIDRGVTFRMGRRIRVDVYPYNNNGEKKEFDEDKREEAAS